MPELVTIAASTTLPARLHLFRPATEREIGRAYRVRVTWTRAVGDDSIIVAEDLADPVWHFELWTNGSVAVGNEGTVRLRGYYRNQSIAWIYRGDRRDDPTTSEAPVQLAAPEHHAERVGGTGQDAAPLDGEGL